MIDLCVLSVEQEVSKPEKSGEKAGHEAAAKEGGVGSSEEKKEAAASTWFCMVHSNQAFDNVFVVVAWIFELYDVAYFTMYFSGTAIFELRKSLQSRKSIISLVFIDASRMSWTELFVAFFPVYDTVYLEIRDYFPMPKFMISGYIENSMDRLAVEIIWEMELAINFWVSAHINSFFFILNDKSSYG